MIKEFGKRCLKLPLQPVAIRVLIDKDVVFKEAKSNETYYRPLILQRYFRKHILL